MTLIIKCKISKAHLKLTNYYMFAGIEPMRLKFGTRIILLIITSCYFEKNLISLIENEIRKEKRFLILRFPTVFGVGE